ncbi:MAG: hypothetical protein Q9181_001512 [Wetmoreana brouardii]
MTQANLHLYTSVGFKGQSAIDLQGKAWWRATENDHWHPAVFHSSIRKALIAEAAQNGSYTFPRNQGSWDDDDITSYHTGQNWGLEREHRPPKTFQFLRTEHTEPTYQVTDWVWHGSVVLDYLGHPILDYTALPATIGSEETGCFLEGMWREDPRITWADFSARMPVSHPPMHYHAVVDYRTYSMRRSRFRLQAACISWIEREGTNEVRAQIENILPPECLQDNSTRGFRDLTKYEMKKVQEASRGKFLEKAGDRALSETKRKEADQAFAKSMDKAKQEHLSKRMRMETGPNPGYSSSKAVKSDNKRANDDELGHYLQGGHQQNIIRDKIMPIGQAIQRISTQSSGYTSGEHFGNPTPASALISARPTLRTIARSYSQEAIHPTPAIDYREVVPVTDEEKHIVNVATEITHEITRGVDLSAHHYQDDGGF